MSDRKQRDVPDGHKSTCENVNTGVPQGFIWGPLLFLIYINNLSGNLSSKARLFANDTSLFNVAHGVMTSEDELKNDLKKVSNWAFQWKMNFNPDPRKQAQEVIFSRKLKKIAHPSLVFNNVKFANVNLKNTYSHFDDILKLFDVLLNFFFTTSETMHDYYS